ncbi:MAG: M1 family aminopeptidase [Gallionella sp.]|nr:M1 family aminopeptidase [Gallionella sp.]
MIRLLPILFVLLWLPVPVVAGSLPTPHMELDIQLDPAAREFTASAILNIHGDTLDFSLYPGLSVTRLVIDGQPHALPRADDGVKRFRLKLGGPGPHHLQLAYQGQLAPLPNLDHKEVLGRLPPMADVRGSYLPAGSGWYPDPGTPFSYRLRLQLPAGQKGLVPGRLIQESDALAYQAEFDFPHPIEGIDLMAGPYTVSERLLERPGQSPLRTRTWFYPDMADLADDYLADSARYLTRYSQEIGPYPFDAFSVVASPLPTGFGIPSLTYIGRDVLRLPFIRATSLGHEVLHNWWGNGVWPDWRSGNWSEGLTTFMADYAYQEDQSAETAKAMRLGWLRDLAAVPDTDDASLATFTARHHGLSSIVGYNKSAMLFLMLRDAIGEKAFVQGLRLFWQRHLFQRAGWADLQRAFADAAERDLGDFFHQWVDRAGAPRLRLTEGVWSDGNLSLVVEQHSPSYALSVPVRLVYEDKQEIRRVEAKGQRSRIVLPAPDRVVAVELDPDYRLWRRVDPAYFPPILREVFVAPRADLLLTDTNPDLRAASVALAGRLLDSRPKLLPHNVVGLSGRSPLLLVGQTASVDSMLARLGLPPRPAELDGRGSAQVWAARDQYGRPYAVVAAHDLPALQALQRGLPHYGRQSWLVFESTRVQDKGIWPVRVEHLVVDMPPTYQP